MECEMYTQQPQKNSFNITAEKLCTFERRMHKETQMNTCGRVYARVAIRERAAFEFVTKFKLFNDQKIEQKKRKVNKSSEVKKRSKKKKKTKKA